VVQEAAEELERDKEMREWPAEGALELRDISLRYRPNTETVLKGISVSIRARERVGIAGRTGSGKSSLTLALFRIVELQRGHILIDGVDIQTLGLHTVRRAMTMIPQDPVLFQGSLRYNLDPCDLYSESEVRAVMQDVGLDFDINKEVKEGGTNFSVGERQLMCIARSGLAHPKILVLDEATSAIDHHTDSLIQQYVRTKFSCTILTIAHRLHTILDSDRVMVLEHGRLVEFDSPKNLLADKESSFCQLAKSLGFGSGEAELYLRE
jgi:ABC-type multidrug transport system fused ATPase/permease subunit